MKATYFRIIPIILIMLIFTSCGSDNPQENQGQGYKDTKTMVIDVLKTKEGQKAIQEAEAGKNSKDKIVKLLATGEGQQIQMAVKEVLTAETGSKMVEKTMTDPKFAGEFAKALQGNLKQINKDLMKDPEYQKSMMELMSNPEFEKMLTSAMKSSAYRQHMMNVIQDSMKSPLFKMQLMELLKKTVEEGVTPKEDKKGEGKKEK